MSDESVELGFEYTHIQKLEARIAELEEEVAFLRKHGNEMEGAWRDDFAKLHIDKTKRVVELEALLQDAKRGHYYCHDTWYSCPKHLEGSAHATKPDRCDCGADAWNARVNKALGAAHD